MNTSHTATLELDGIKDCGQIPRPTESLSQRVKRPGSKAAAPLPALAACVVIGTLKGFGKSGELTVDFPSNPIAHAVTAKSTIQLGEKHSGCEVVLVFEEG